MTPTPDPQADSRKAQLELQIAALRQELNEITDAEWQKECKSFEGRCFKVRNNYSCPETPADYWWMYLRVTNTTDGITTLNVQRDKDGRITIEQEQYLMPVTLNGYKEITRGEWNKAYAEILAEAERLA